MIQTRCIRWHNVFVLHFRYTLYTKTRLGYMYFKREMRKAREHYPAGHSTAQPMELNGIQQLQQLQQQLILHRRAMVVSLPGKREKILYSLAGAFCDLLCILLTLVVNKQLCRHTVQHKAQKPLNRMVFSS